MEWFTRFAAVSAAVIVGLMLVAWGIGGFAALGLHGNGLAAFVLGVFFTCALGIALMGLIFYSARSGQDETVYHPTVTHPDERG